jgi:hypothetical protein
VTQWIIKVTGELCRASLKNGGLLVRQSKERIELEGGGGGCVAA